MFPLADGGEDSTYGDLLDYEMRDVALAMHALGVMRILLGIPETRGSELHR